MGGIRLRTERIKKEVSIVRAFSPFSLRVFSFAFEILLLSVAHIQNPRDQKCEARQTDGSTDRTTDRQTELQTDRQKYRQTDRQRQTSRQTDRQTPDSQANLKADG